MAPSSQQSGVVADGYYSTFRKNGEPTYYDEHHTPWHADILESGFIFAACVLALAFYAMLPGVHGRGRFFAFLWITSSVFVGSVILITNYGYEWESGTVLTATKYKAGTGRDITATVGLHIGLRGINITLKGDPVSQLNETINYDEHLGWSWSQGRIGFGIFSSEFNQEYRAAQFRGVPLPVLWVAEYFTFDGEGIRWGRFYRMAGHYANLCLWLALPLWILANVLVFVLLRYGAYFSVMTGLSMLSANVIRATVRNPTDLQIPFEHVLKLQYGTSFWLCLTTGLFCVVVGLVVLVMDLRWPSLISKFFSVDILQDSCVDIDREGTGISQHSSATTRTDDTDLTEIVEVGSSGEVRRGLGIRPPGAPRTGTNGHVTGAGRALDDVYGDGDGKDQWEDYSSSESESDLEPTDDEYEEAEYGNQEENHQTHKNKVARGFIQRFQARRRSPLSPNQTPQSSANIGRRRNSIFANLRGKTTVTPANLRGKTTVTPANLRGKTTVTPANLRGKITVTPSQPANTRFSYHRPSVQR